MFLHLACWGLLQIPPLPLQSLLLPISFLAMSFLVTIFDFSFVQVFADLYTITNNLDA